MTKLADNVYTFMDVASIKYGQMMRDRFSQNMWDDCHNVGMASPIEHLFWIAFHAMCQAHCMKAEVGPKYDEQGTLSSDAEIFISAQRKVGKYAVDFFIEQSGVGPDTSLTPVIVELDGHDFHDKDKRQRSYEKARDRFLLKEGLRVVHFTGSDVAKDPFAVAWEVLEMLGVMACSGVEKYDPQNPLDGGA